MTRIQSRPISYALSFLVSALAVLPWWFVQSTQFRVHYYLTLWPAVLFSAWYCGLGPAILAIVTTLLGTWFFLLPRVYSFRVENPSDILGMTVFVLFSCVVVALVETSRRSHALQVHQAELLDVADEAIIELSTAADTIVYWNQGAEKLYGWSKAEVLGQNVHALLHTVLAVPLEECKAELKREGHWEGEAIHTRRDGRQITVMARGSLRTGTRTPSRTWLQICRDITEKKRAEQESAARLVTEAQLRASREAEGDRMRSEEALRHLSVRLLRVQDEERRRIARELHDSAGQYLAMLNMALGAARRDPASQSRNLDSAAELTQKCISEIRTISHLLHPPLLDELGLASAVRWYVEGFAARSGIQVSLDVPKQLDRMEHDVELVLFRVLQESLTNIHRHSGSATAAVRMGVESGQAWLEIHDQGKGNPELSSTGFRPGIGIAGMRERVKDLAGVLEITSDPTGTRVRAVLPLPVESGSAKPDAKASTIAS